MKYMKKKLFMLLAMVMTAMTASAVAGYTLGVGTNEHGTITFKVGTNDNAEYAQEGDEVTVTITPDAGYVVNQPTGQWIAAMAKAPRRTQGIGLLKDVELTPVEGQENLWKFTMERADVEISATYKKLIQASWIQNIAAVTYNGEEQEPTVTVMDGTTKLTLGTDYTVSYSNNVNAALATAAQNAPTVTITAASTSEKYSGTASKTFTINKAEITSSHLTAPTTEELTYNGQDQTLVIAGQVEGGAVVYSLDGQTYSAELPTGKDAGAYMVYYKVVPDANHFTNLAAQFVLQTIYKAALTSVTLASTELVYNQQAQTPEVSSVKAGEFTVPADDYTVSGSGTTVGTYMLTVTAKSTAKNFTGSTSTQFYIVEANASLFTLTLDPNEFVYDGQEKQLAVEVKDGDAVLVEDTDYTIAYSDNVNVGTATVTVMGLGNYEGTKTATFAIVRDMSTVFSEGSSWATYVAQEDLTLPEGVEAYTVSGATATEVSVEAISYIPVGVGVLLKRSNVEKADFKGYAYEGVTATIESLLVGSATEATDMTAYKDFVLYRDEFVLGGASSVAAGHAYLPAANATTGAARRSIVIGGETTGIGSLTLAPSPKGEGSVYTLDGRKVNGNPTRKGVYIQNGKKVVVK